MFGKEVKQKGSAITNEKARFDFTLPENLSQEQLQLIEQIDEVYCTEEDFQHVSSSNEIFLLLAFVSIQLLI